MNKFLIIVFLFLFINVFPKEDYKILSSSETSLIVEFTPNYLNNGEITLENNTYINLNIENCYTVNNDEVGAPQILVRTFDIGVPNEFGNNLRVLSSEFERINGKIKPIPNVKKVNSLPSYEYSETENYLKYTNPEIATFGDYGLVRDARVQTVKIFPVKFDPSTQEIQLLKRLVFQVTFGSASNLNKLSKSDLTEDVVINQNVAKNWGSTKKIAKVKSAVNTVLAEGNWYRFEAPEEGIYKITPSFLSSLGITVSNVDPRTIKIYNNGGYYLPWNVNGERPEDLVEVATYASGESDGVFNTDDYFLLYGRGIGFWEYNDITNKIQRNRHFYSKHNYFWLTYGGAQGKRMQTQASLNSTNYVIQSTTKAYRFQENDNQNLIGSGLLYVDDDYTSSSPFKTYVHTLDGLVDGSEVNYTFTYVNGSTNSNLLSVTENGSPIFSKYLFGASGIYVEYMYGKISTNYATSTNYVKDKRSVLKFTFNPSSISDKGHLDYLEIEYKQDLKAMLDGQCVIFFSGNSGTVQYEGSPFNSSSNFRVFNITDFSNPKIINSSINGGTFKFITQEDSNFSSKYMAFRDSDWKTPSNGEKVENSNIRGVTEGSKYLIITAKDFKDQANRLKDFRQNTAQLKVSSEIVYVDEIYNEFSGGSLDPTAIRDFLKYAYENRQVKPEYVLLFGDGDWDYFNVLGKNLNFVPTYQTTESLYEINSYPHDDYYSRIVGSDDMADLGIGRLNVASVDDAEIVVDKIINYETELDKGVWRSKITLLADDGLGGYENGSIRYEGNMHTEPSEVLSKKYIPEYFEREKIYLSNYQTINTGLGRRKPDCNAAIINAINNGTLIFNYFGHGNPDVWAHEIVFDRSISIPQLKNKELFFLTAATCDFGRYDNPNVQSSTEEMILKENAGMIGGISAVRPVFANDNEQLDFKFYSFLLGEQDSLGYPNPLGKVFQKLKRERIATNDEKFHLFADPYLRLNIPKLPVEITSVNDANSADTVDIKALSHVTIKGKVKDINNNNSNYEGEGIISVFDSERTVHLDDINYDITTQGGVIYRGRVTVENGEFTTSFTVPKDISYENRNGKIIAYFFNDNIDGVGYTKNIIVGGTDSTNSNDGKGPEIEILYDDETESSYLVNPNFKLRVKLFDETGLNTTGTGIGHKLEAVLNEDEQNAIDLTKYFIGDLNSGGKSGEVNYNFSSLSTGEYKIKINAWDVFNNFSSQEDYFTVVTDNDLVVREVYNYPNPFSSNTYFTFQHNFNDPINVKIKIFTIAGRVIKEIERFNIDDKFVKIEWDGKDEDNNKIGNGTYLYKLIVKTADNKVNENILGKMAVIR